MSVFRNNFYSSTQQYEKQKAVWFDEGPLITKKYIGVNSSSISTADIDQFRQGVEITQEKYSIGTYKISAGTPGHIVNPLSYGVSNLDISTADYYIDLSNFDPVYYINAQAQGVDFVEKVINFPIITDDTDTAENNLTNGIIEPLTIRAVASFYSIESPFESRSVKGSVMGGNPDRFTSASDMVLTVDDYIDLRNDSWYIDAFEYNDMVEGIKIKRDVGYINEKMEAVAPFDDSKKYFERLGISAQTHGEQMAAAFLQLSETLAMNYVPPGKKAAASGFVYDSYTGTDSITFGGMLH